MATTRKSAARKTKTRNSATAARQATGSTGRGRSNRATPDRDSEGRFKPDHHVRNAAVGTAAVLGAAAAGIAAAFRFGLLDRFLPASEGHSAEDLLIDDDAETVSRPTGRAPKDFRPDIDAPMTKAEKEALRPATGKPSITASEGEIASA